VIELTCGTTTVLVDVDHGGRLAQIDAGGGRHLLVDASARHDGPVSGIHWGCFVMVPWAGRVRGGRFTVDGTEHQLDVNHRDHVVDAATGVVEHAIHGVGFAMRWKVIVSDARVVELGLGLDGLGGWPFGGRASQRIDVGERHVRLTASVTAGDAPMPAEIGWHPWFVKPERVELAAGAMYETDGAGIPTGRLIAPTDPPWDDCFVTDGPVTLRGCGGLDVVVASDCDHWVVYDHLPHATCVEPQSGPPDAFTIRPRVLGAGATLRRTMTISWEPTISE
jgi:aldose 1-epimerase